MLALGSAGFLFYRKRQEREAARLREAAEQQPIEDRYLADLKEAVDLKSQDVVGSFAALSKLCRHYLVEKYGFPALEITTSEIAEQLQRQAVSTALVEHVREILNQSDVAKFSGGQVEPGILERVYTLMEEILNRNKSEQVSISVEQNGGAQNS
ncbi:MAG: hypothetical protein D6743_05205 [Calditrichaeota bacterium]|nr:MAG: hypothetical protein D6743_05205 [Calditrichota bacterium]